MLFTIKKKLMIYVTTLIAIAIIATAIPAYYIMSTNLQKSHEQKVLQTLHGFHNLFDIYKKDAAKQADLIAAYPGLSQKVDDKDVTAIKQLLNPFTKSNIDFITITDKNGLVLFRSHDIKTGDNILNQRNIQTALHGTTLATIEPGASTRLSIRAGSPLRDRRGNIIGAISTGYNITTNEMVDKLKNSYGIEATIFHGDEPIATTIMKDHQRLIATKLDHAIAEKVLNQGTVHVENASILGIEYITGYMPLIGTNNRPIGVLFAGENMSRYAAERTKLLITIISIALITQVLAMAFTFLLAQKLSNLLASWFHSLLKKDSLSS